MIENTNFFSFLSCRADEIICLVYIDMFCKEREKKNVRK